MKTVLAFLEQMHIHSFAFRLIFLIRSVVPSSHLPAQLVVDKSVHQLVWEKRKQISNLESVSIAANPFFYLGVGWIPIYL